MFTVLTPVTTIARPKTTTPFSSEVEHGQNIKVTFYSPTTLTLGLRQQTLEILVGLVISTPNVQVQVHIESSLAVGQLSLQWGHPLLLQE